MSYWANKTLGLFASWSQFKDHFLRPERRLAEKLNCPWHQKETSKSETKTEWEFNDNLITTATQKGKKKSERCKKNNSFVENKSCTFNPNFYPFSRSVVRPVHCQYNNTFPSSSKTAGKLIDGKRREAFEPSFTLGPIEYIYTHSKETKWFV